MKHELAFMVNNKNKERFIGAAAESILKQECEPFLAVLSDNNSTDASKAILNDLADKYDGPHTVLRLDLPPQDSDGMPGLNAHIDYCMEQFDCPYIIQLSGDDYSLPRRAQRTLDAFRSQDPSMVLTGQYTCDETGHYVSETPYPHTDGWVAVKDMFPQYVGGSSSQAWTREFYEKIGGIKGCLGSSDVLMPLLACLHKGAYFIHERLQCYRKVLGPDNTGLENIYFAIPEADTGARQQVEELMHFQVAVGLYELLGKMQDAKLSRRDAEEALSLALSDRCASLVNCRKRLSLAKLPPLLFKT